MRNPPSDKKTRIAAKFAELKQARRKALIPFFTAGFPSVSETVRLALTASSAGADLLEIGMPFSDPLADGPAIQFSSQQALTSGLKMKDTLSLVEKVATKSGLPIALMGYYNPIWALGLSRFVRLASSAGVNGLIIPDLPPEEAGELAEVASQYGMTLTFLVAPTTDAGRYSTIADSSTGFVYAVTVAGVTGVRTSFARKTDAYLRSLKRAISRPVVAGFGISSGRTAQEMARWVDGVVVGSAFIDLTRANTRLQARGLIGSLIDEIRKSLDSLDSDVNG